MRRWFAATCLCLRRDFIDFVRRNQTTETKWKIKFRKISLSLTWLSEIGMGVKWWFSNSDVDIRQSVSCVICNRRKGEKEQSEIIAFIHRFKSFGATFRLEEFSFFFYFLFFWLAIDERANIGHASKHFQMRNFSLTFFFLFYFFFEHWQMALIVELKPIERSLVRLFFFFFEIYSSTKINTQKTLWIWLCTKKCCCCCCFIELQVFHRWFSFNPSNSIEKVSIT